MNARIERTRPGGQTAPEDRDGRRLRDPTADHPGGPDLNTLDEQTRRESVEAIKSEIDKADHLDAMRLRLLAGDDPGDDARPDVKSQLVASLDETCEYVLTVTISSSR